MVYEHVLGAWFRSMCWVHGLGACAGRTHGNTPVLSASGGRVGTNTPWLQVCEKEAIPCQVTGW